MPRLEGQAGIAIQRTAGVVLDSVHVSNTYGDAVYITGGATNVTVRNSTLEKTGRQGVAIVNAQHVTVEGNQIRDVARSVFDLEPPGRARVQDIHLSQNTVGDYVNFLLASGGGGPGVGDVWLQGNHVDGGHGVSVFAGIEGQRRTGYHVLDNTGTGAQRPTGGTGRAGLLQLRQPRPGGDPGQPPAVAGVPAISADRVCGLTVSGNDFPGASTQQQVVRACGAAAPAPRDPEAVPDHRADRGEPDHRGPEPGRGRRRRPRGSPARGPGGVRGGPGRGCGGVRSVAARPRLGRELMPGRISGP